MRSLARTSLIVLLGCTVVLAGCETLQNASTNPDYSKTRRNAGYGAAAGAVVGLLTRGDKLQNALIGAAVGGLAGGAVGNYQDRQERKLREQMAGTGVSVVRQGNNITLDLPSGITFASNSADLSADFYPVLDKVSDSLREYGETVIEVAGHTDSTGTHAFNKTLSERRARSVVAYLSSRGVQSTRLIAVGDGPDHPVASNATAEGRQLNRRVEMTIVPVQKTT
jgi:outer membrane protein OmpA-like peptidoglycan-associated protein